MKRPRTPSTWSCRRAHLSQVRNRVLATGLVQPAETYSLHETLPAESAALLEETWAHLSPLLLAAVGASYFRPVWWKLDIGLSRLIRDLLFLFFFLPPQSRLSLPVFLSTTLPPPHLDLSSATWAHESFCLESLLRCP